MIGQKEWIKKNYTDNGIKPWICTKCGNPAQLHECINGTHTFLCPKCIFEREFPDRKYKSNYQYKPDIPRT